METNYWEDGRFRKSWYSQRTEIILGYLLNIHAGCYRPFSLTKSSALFHEKFIDHGIYHHQQHSIDKEYFGSDHEVQQDMPFSSYRNNGSLRLWSGLGLHYTLRVLQGKAKLWSFIKMRMLICLNRPSVLSRKCLSYDKMLG